MPWWCHDMDTLSALLAVTVEFPAQRVSITCSDDFFVVYLNKIWSKQSSCAWFRAPWHSRDVALLRAGNAYTHDDVIKWKHIPRCWPFVRGIHRWPVNSPHKGQWRGALMFSLICAWMNGWVNNREPGDLRRYRAHYDVIEMDVLTHCYGKRYPQQHQN